MDSTFIELIDRLGVHGLFSRHVETRSARGHTLVVHGPLVARCLRLLVVL